LRTAPQPYQEKQETAEYRVLHSPSVVVRDRPWGSVIGSVQSGDVVKVTHRTIGLNDSVWVKTQEAFGSDGLLGFGASQKETGWMLVDGRCMNLPLLLDKVERRKGIVTRYRVVVDEADIRERPSLAGTPIVGRRKKGAILRTDQELNGWVRLQADFYVTGKAEPVEGWSLISGQSMGMGPILARWEPYVPCHHPPVTTARSPCCSVAPLCLLSPSSLPPSLIHSFTHSLARSLARANLHLLLPRLCVCVCVCVSCWQCPGSRVCEWQLRRAGRTDVALLGGGGGGHGGARAPVGACALHPRARHAPPCRYRKGRLGSPRGRLY
jgi:hypothetical protein